MWTSLDCVDFQQQLLAGQGALGNPSAPDRPPILNYLYRAGPLIGLSALSNLYRAGPLLGGSAAPNLYRAGPLLPLRGVKLSGRP